MIRLVVGLGNPGTQYEGTRHNAGFWWVDAVAQQLRATLAPQQSYHGLVARVNRPQGPLWLLEPMTYMNLSGKSVAALARFFKIEAGDILVAHDDLDLQPGQVRIKLGGSNAGHNGLKDIQAALGSPMFWRLRLGIGHPRTLNLDQAVHDFVLHPPRREELQLIETELQRSMAIIPDCLAGRMEAAMLKLHTRPREPRPQHEGDQPGPAASR